MLMQNEEHESLLDLLDLYKKAKALILYSEEIDEYQSTNVQVPKELRDAFDHLMNVVELSEYPSSEIIGQNRNLIKSNIEKAISHVFRAGFDALDGAVMSLKEEIYRGLKPFPSDIILKALPNYGELKIKIHEICTTIAGQRENKGISTEVISSVFDRYLIDLEELKKIHHKIYLALPTIAQFYEEHRKEKRNSIIWRILIGFIVSLLGFLIGIIFKF